MEIKRLSTVGLAAATLLFGVAATWPKQEQPQRSPIYGVELPKGYRDWQVISVAHEAGKNNDIRAILGNDIAMKAYRQNIRPFPDGAIIVRVAWQYESSPRNDSVFPAPQSFVAGAPTNVQVSEKDSKRFAKTGGWGYAQFEKGVADPSVPLIQSCYACHIKLDAIDKEADLVFTNYSE